MKTNNFKPNCTYNFSDSDLKFIIQLAKVGKVNILSNQICLTSCENQKLVFLDYGRGESNERACDGMTLPDGWIIEGIYTEKDGCPSITFGIDHNNK